MVIIMVISMVKETMVELADMFMIITIIGDIMVDIMADIMTDIMMIIMDMIIHIIMIVINLIFDKVLLPYLNPLSFYVFKIFDLYQITVSDFFQIIGNTLRTTLFIINIFIFNDLSLTLNISNDFVYVNFNNNSFNLFENFIINKFWI